MLISEHYKIDPDTGGLLGPLRQDDNLSRDVHDWFNLVALIPMNILNAMNWSWPLFGTVSPQEMWRGNYFWAFYMFSCAYFVADALWVFIIPNCVRSPGVILQHHVAALLYLSVPGFYPEYGWLAGVNLSVEVNTWLIIARRVFNKNGLVVWDVGGHCEIKIISILFYITWFLIRVILYPILLIYVIQAYIARCKEVGSIFNAMTLSPLLQTVFCMLNIQWTCDLFKSKMKAKKGDGPSKGL